MAFRNGLATFAESLCVPCACTEVSRNAVLAAIKVKGQARLVHLVKAITCEHILTVTLQALSVCLSHAAAGPAAGRH